MWTGQPGCRAHTCLHAQVYASFLREEGQAPFLTRCFSHELCAGLVDKAKSLEEIASEEVCVVTVAGAEMASIQDQGVGDRQARRSADAGA